MKSEDLLPPPALCTSGRPRTPCPPPPSLFSTEHIPRVADVKRNCVVCWKREKVEKKITTYCSAPQCEGKFMHITRNEIVLKFSTAQNIIASNSLVYDGLFCQSLR